MHTIAKSVWDSRICLILIALLTALTLTLFLWAGSGETVSANPFPSTPSLVSEQSTTVTSRGVAAHGAKAWHDAGYKGGGSNPIKVGIIDSSFGGFSRLMGSELPPAGNRPRSALSGPANRLRPSYTPSQAPHRYQFQWERRNWSARNITGTLVDTNSDSGAAPAFSYLSAPELSGPTIALSGLTGSYIAGDTAAFSVTLSDLTLNQSYTVTFTSSHSSVGFNFRCNYLPTESFAAARRAKTLNFTLHACNSPGGTITAQLRQGNASGAIVATATATATVTAAAGSLSPVPSAITVGHDQTFTVTTNVPDSNGVYIAATHRGDSGRLTLPTSQGCHQASSGRAAVNGDTITLRGCQAGTATLTLHRSNSVLQPLASYTVTVNESDTRLLPEPGSITVGHDQTFILDTGIPNDPGVWITATVAGDAGRTTLPPTESCLYASSGRAAVDGNPITLRGCRAGVTTLTIYRSNSSVLLASYTVTVDESDTRLLPEPGIITVGHDQTFILNTGVPHDPGVWVTATVSGDAGRATLPPTRGCHQTSSGIAAFNGNAITLRGCKEGQVTLTLYRANSSVLLASYTVTVIASNTNLSPEPATFTVGHDQTFTVNTDIANNPGVWVSVTASGDPGQLTLPPTRGCYHPTSGIAAISGSAITIRGCKVGTATITIYRANSGELLKSYTVTVAASNTGLSPEPATFIAGHDQTFTVNTDIPDSAGVYITATLSGDPGRLTLPPTRGCYHPTSGLAAVNGNTITIRGCRAGTATITIYRANSGALLKSYTVTVAASNTSLSPEPATFIAGHDQTFTVNTDIPDSAGVYITATLNGDAGRLTLPPTRGCYHPTSGLAAVNGNTITIRGCRAGTATITIYRANSGALLKSYTVTVNASDTELSPAPATFTIGTNQTFTLTTDIANNPGVWVGLNYAGDTGRLVMSNQSCALNSGGTAAVNGNTITLKPCRAGTVTIKVGRSNSGVFLVTYEVTINAA